jgi:putative chitinase
MTATFAADLLRLSPTASKAIVQGIADNSRLLDEAGINTPIRLRHFLARVCVETGGLRSLEEDLSYTAQRLTQVWPNRFPTIAAATPFARNPQKLANRVYGGRLGNFKPNDGWTYRGSGLLQNTGRENFELVEDATGLPVVDQPELLRTFPGALEAATIFWTKRNINALADKNDVTGVCKAVNGGTNGLADQRTWLAKAAKIWPDDGSKIEFPKLSNTPQPVNPLPIQPAQPAPSIQAQPPQPAPPVIDQKPSIPAASEPIPAPPVITPTPPATGSGIVASVVAALALTAMAVAGWWHHVVSFIEGLFQ